MRTRRRIWAPVLAVAAVLVGACGDAQESSLSPPVISAATTTTLPAPPPTTAAPPTTAPAPPTTAPSPTQAPAPTTTVVDYEDAPGFLALGDSYTIGESVKRDERWPKQLTELLREAGVAVAEPTYVAETGWRTSELASALETAELDPPYGLVTLQIGVNNQFNSGDLEVFRTEFAQLLDAAIALAGDEVGRVVVLSIPDWGVTPFAPDLLLGRIAFEIAKFNEIVVEESADRGVAFVDVTPSSKKAKDDPSLLSFDDLHPSGLMYAEWAQLAFPPASAAFTAFPLP